MKDEKVKEVKKEKNDLDGRVSALERLVGKLNKAMEIVHSEDFNDDGKIGSTRIGTMLISCLITVTLGLGAVFASENIDLKSAGTGTYSLDQASLGTGDITLTVDAIASTVTGSAVYTSAPTTTADIGALNATNVTSVVESGNGISHRTVVTLNGVASAIADGGFEASQWLYTFPEGRILVEGVTCDITAILSTTNFNTTANDLYNVAVGTAINDDGDGTISATGANLIPNVSVDTTSGTVRTNAIASALATSAQFDGTTTPSRAYLNWAVPAANDNGANTNHFTGTITFTWKNLGDY